MNMENTQAENSVAVKRPTSITVICVICFLGLLFAIPIILSPQAREIGGWYPPFVAFSSLTGLVSMIGLWKMRKWAFFLYAGMMVINQLVMVIKGVWVFNGLILPLLVTVIVSRSFKLLK